MKATESSAVLADRTSTGPRSSMAGGSSPWKQSCTTRNLSDSVARDGTDAFVAARNGLLVSTWSACAAPAVTVS